MITKAVKSSEMLSVLALSIAKDMSPEPYSRQSDLCLMLSFTEFVNLCSNIKQYGDNILNTPSAQLEKLASNCINDPAARKSLFKIYMQELAYAICREISYHQRYGKGLTKISRLETGQIVLTYDEFKTEYSESTLTLKMLIRKVHEIGYPLEEDHLSEEAYYALHQGLAYYKYAGLDMSYTITK